MFFGIVFWLWNCLYGSLLVVGIGWYGWEIGFVYYC